jgi:NADH:ubiquinone oxidoreductase subunit C
MSLSRYLINLFPKYIFFAEEENSIFLDIDMSHLGDIIVCLSCFNTTQYKTFTDLTAVDYPNKNHRMLLVYNIYSIPYYQRLLLRGWVMNTALRTESISCWFPSASWYEREVFDLFGVFFTAHADLRRILTDYGFDGHPMRKDYPLVGFVELKYNLTSKLLSYDSIKLLQEWRAYTLNKQWIAR